MAERLMQVSNGICMPLKVQCECFVETRYIRPFAYNCFRKFDDWFWFAAAPTGLHRLIFRRRNDSCRRKACALQRHEVYLFFLSLELG